MSDKSETSWDSDCSEPVSASGGGLWDVQDILAECTTVLGGKELLVVWKTSWIPKRNMISDGPVMQRWTEARKCKFKLGLDYIRLAVEPGSTLAMDCDWRIAAEHLAEHRLPARRGAVGTTTAASKQQLGIAPSPAAEAAKPSSKRRQTG